MVSSDCVCATVAAYWCGGRVGGIHHLTPPEDPLQGATQTTVTVTEGSLSHSLSLTAFATWEKQHIGTNHASGVVTAVSLANGTEVGTGTVLYRVNLRPVVVAQGDTPAFRDITRGTSGEDVAQLQAMLAETGFFHGEVDGEAGWDTVAAIRAWQAELGVESSGIVAQGDIIFVPTLPARLALDTQLVARGEALSGGEHVLLGISGSPSFQIPLTEAQAAKIPTGTEVQLLSPSGAQWAATVSEIRRETNEGDGVRAVLLGGEDAAICQDLCNELPIGQTSSLPAEIVLLAEVTGLVVPVAAIVTGADGEAALVDTAGVRHPIRVLATAKGMSVVSGVSEGLQVRLFGEAEERS